MKKKNLNLLEDFYAEHLAIINDAKFTKREIDIIACILHGRTAKGSAILLSILPRTVQVHTQNIRNKLGVSSREGIINFIESSEKLLLVRDYYSKLLVECAFDKKLDEISKLKLQQNNKLLIVYGVWIKDKKSFFEKLEKNLEKAGLKASVCEYRSDQINDKKRISSQTHIIFAEEEIKSNSSDTLPNREYLDLSTCQNYYTVMFEILKRFYPSGEIEKINSTIKEEDNEGKISSASKVDQSSPELLLFSPEGRRYENRKPLLWRRGIALCCLAIGILVATFSQTEKEIDQIRSDLFIPTESVLLHRPELLKEIDNIFKRQGGIQTIAFIGPGGVGKTTLARQYAHQQKSSVVWEINAETQESLNRSFEKLAQAISKTEISQKRLKEIQVIQDTTEREEKMIQFVKEQLRGISNWFLIYDNVDSFTDIQKYFPYDSATWGQGKIILTTRNNNIQNNKHLDHAIQVGELDLSQRLSLFNKIMSNGYIELENEEKKAFLEKISPFPLDVSIAAYYLKATNTSYSKYLELLRENNKCFNNLQKSLLKESGNYTETRYGIISLSLKHLIGSNRDFEDLLLFVSLLGSQNIPKDLLSTYKKDALVDEFIHNLKKYSLITSEKSANHHTSAVFSLHRSTQEIMLAYLLKEIASERSSQLIKSISSSLETYITHVIEERDFIKMRVIMGHCEMFLNHPNLLTNNILGAIGSGLGMFYVFQFTPFKAKHTLEQSLVYLNKHGGHETYPKIAQTLAYLSQAHWQVGHFEKVRALAEQSLLIYKKYSPQNYSGIGQSLEFLGNVHRILGNYSIAKYFLEESILMFKKKYNKNHIRIAGALSLLACVHYELGDYEKAKTILEQSLTIYKKYYPENYYGIGRALSILGSILRKLGNYEKAKTAHEESHIVYEKHFQETNFAVAWNLENLGTVYMELGEYNKARELINKCLLIWEEVFGRDHSLTARVLLDLGYVYFLEGNIETAENLIIESLRIFQKDNHPESYRSLESLGEVYLKKSRNSFLKKDMQQSQAFRKQAIDYLNQALKIAEMSFPPDSSHIKRIQGELKKLEHRIANQ